MLTLTVTLAALFLPLVQDLPQDPAPGSLTLRYGKPASKWTEALPVGNGKLGAMPFGGVHEERVLLNEDSVWAGRPIERDRSPKKGTLEKARELLFAGKYVEGEALVQKEFMSKRLIRSYQTLGNLRISFLHAAKKPESYERDLDLDSAIARVRYAMDGADFERQVFASVPRKVIVYHVRTSDPKGIDCRIRLDRPEQFKTEVTGHGLLRMRGRVDKDKESEGVRYEALCLVTHDGGSQKAEQGEKGPALHVSQAKELTIYIAATTSFPGRGEFELLPKRLRAAAELPFAELRREHIEAHRALFRRVSLSLGGTEKRKLFTDERLRAVKKGQKDPDLLALYFQFGRYLLISSSRPGSLPANLQGLWSPHIKAPWNADYHININLQMNYWPAEMLALPECHMPFFDLVDRIRVRGRETAKKLYDCGGFVAHHTSDAWAFASPIGRTSWGMWPTGGAWCTRHYFEHYRFTQDKDFLKSRAWPLLRESAEFFLDYLTEDPKSGKLVSGPSMSPENAFQTKEGKVAHVTMGPAMDQEIIEDLFRNCLEAADVLGIENAFTKRIRDARKRLQGPQIGQDGRLLEWNEEFKEPYPGHRHMSHLFALHPGRQITILGTKKLADAARKSLEYRLSHGGGHTGWSRAWIINFFARLADGDRALENVWLLLAKSTMPNLFDNHPPFQIDGNFGGAAGIGECLLQSHAGVIDVLPALPKALPSGSVAGLRARGGFTLDFAWRKGKLLFVTVHARSSGPCRLRASIPLEASGADPKDLKRDGKRLSFEAEAGTTYVFVEARS